ncbi:androgen-induced gene 1 protein-like [Condylostylus longicornis]|uniref:androgen-induced gene 1 protein-like n=1 Tax=Condylostylus longicornis TaxID=2530218 RepID=UPI00244E3FD1|nr:androgen-induced gene 1 protein-like [Condylostylus longicornis]
MSKNKSNKTNAEVAHRGVYSTLKTLVHLIAFVQFSYAIYYDYTYVHAKQLEHQHKLPAAKPFGGKFKFLTFIDAVLQAVYFAICLVNDFFGSNEVSANNLPLIRKLKDFLLASLAFPIAMNVGITFWTLMAIDRELVFPKALDLIFPWWLNHIMHTNIMIFISLEMFTTFRVYPNRRTGLGVLSTFMILYLIWIHIIRYIGGFWVYPILDVLNIYTRIIFFLIILAFTIVLYLFGELVNNLIWTRELKLISRKTK